MRNLPPTIPSSTGHTIRLIIPNTYIPASYHPIHLQTTKLIEEHKPDLIVHVGLAMDRDYYAIEQSAMKDGYHDIPGQDRRVFTRAENKKVFGKAASSLSTSLDLATTVSLWQNACSKIGLKEKGTAKAKEKGKVNKVVDVRMSDDVGTFVCGFIYYVSLLEMQRRTGRRDVVFLHVPMLRGEEEVGVGVEVLKALVAALVEGWRGGAL